MRWCVTELTLNLEGNLEITSFVKPSIGLKVKTNMANEETEKLIREDVVVCGEVQMTWEKVFCF